MKDLGERETTFRTDFCIADKYWPTAIKDTYKRAFKEWKKDIVYITELVIVLNRKLHEHFGKGHSKLAELYNQLWESTHNWCLENLKDKDLEYYLDKTD